MTPTSRTTEVSASEQPYFQDDASLKSVEGHRHKGKEKERHSALLTLAEESLPVGGVGGVGSSSSDHPEREGPPTVMVEETLPAPAPENAGAIEAAPETPKKRRKSRAVSKSTEATPTSEKSPDPSRKTRRSRHLEAEAPESPNREESKEARKERKRKKEVPQPELEVAQTPEVVQDDQVVKI